MDSRDRVYPAICARCGKETTVPFKPDGVRPVYCPECLKLVRGYNLESFIADNHHRHDIIKLGDCVTSAPNSYCQRDMNSMALIELKLISDNKIL